MARPLEQASAARNAAHEEFRSQLAQVQEDLAARGIGGRIADRVGEVAVEAAEVAGEHKAAIAGAVAVLTLWILRNPIISLFEHLWSAGKEAKGNSEDD